MFLDSNSVQSLNLEFITTISQLQCYTQKPKLFAIQNYKRINILILLVLLLFPAAPISTATAHDAPVHLSLASCSRCTSTSEQSQLVPNLLPSHIGQLPLYKACNPYTLCLTLHIHIDDDDLASLLEISIFTHARSRSHCSSSSSLLRARSTSGIYILLLANRTRRYSRSCARVHSSPSQLIKLAW